MLVAGNESEQSLPDRRFILGGATYYEQPDVWALEIAPYDTASADMVATLYDAVEAASFFGLRLIFHPTSDAVIRTAAELPARIPQVDTEDLFGDYQPLNLGTAIGFLRFVEVEHLEEEYLGFQDLFSSRHVHTRDGVNDPSRDRLRIIHEDRPSDLHLFSWFCPVFDGVR